MYIDVYQMSIFLNNKKKLLICEFFCVTYLHLSSVALNYWIHDVSQKARDHLIDKLLEEVGGAPSPKLITLPTLMVFVIVKLVMHLFAHITWSNDRWVMWLDGCCQLDLSHTLITLVTIVLAKVEIKPFFAYRLITWSMSHASRLLRYPHPKLQKLW